jgi:hypothetical protein
MDAGDKAPGKAITYATKISHIKVFGFETGEDEESRAEQRDTSSITDEQVSVLWDLLVDEHNMLNAKGIRLAKAYNFQRIQDIKPKKFDQILKDAKK